MKRLPYIKQEKRKQFDWVISNIVAFLEAEPEDIAGNLNYVITSILKKLSKDLRYKKANELMGVLECVKQEYYRKVVVPYEILKEKENGEVE